MRAREASAAGLGLGLGLGLGAHAKHPLHGRRRMVPLAQLEHPAREAAAEVRLDAG